MGWLERKVRAAATVLLVLGAICTVAAAMQQCGSMPEKAAGKLQETIQKIINDGGGTLFCFIL